MSIRQVWKRKTPLPKSSPIFHNDSPPPPPTNTPHSISPPMNYPQRDKMINQLQTISILIEYETPSPPSSPHPLVPPPTHAQVGCHASFCHCCRLTALLCGPHVKTSWQVTQAKAKKDAKAKVDKEQATKKADKGKSVAEIEESPKRFTRGDAKRQADKEVLNKESEEEDEDDVVHEGSDSEDEEMMDVKTKKATKGKNKKEALRSKGKK
ncbi:hypothetical protein Tco_1031908 [Tanacetum coccineum]|uniref:Uncharacterized protein n=1 Tax=Tanacetum coccineum TaxID=301880 RepID=A0ABQ5GCM0_9ASTR